MSSTIICSGGATYTGLTGGILLAPVATSRAKTIIRWFRSLTKMPSLSRSGLASGFRRKQNGSSLRAGVWPGSPLCGAVNSGLMAGGWRIPIKVISLTRIQARMGTWASHRWHSTPRTGMVCTTWPAMYGNGRAIGIVPTTMRSYWRWVESRAIRRGLSRRSILPIPASPRRFTAEDHFSAPISTARATWSAREEKVK